MKKILSILAVLTLCAPAALAAGRAKSNVGCGLGAMLWGDKADDSLLFQLFMGTTNNTFYSQTFGMTSGTSECTRPDSLVLNERGREFILANLDNLARDIASGSGETVSTLAELMKVPATDRTDFYRNLQAHFADIFPRPDVDYAHVADTIVLVATQG
jgi:hypothetical protein